MFIVGNNAIGKGGFVPAAKTGYLLTVADEPPLILTKTLKRKIERISVHGAEGGVGNSRLPSGYTELVCITSDGDSYINTDLRASADMGMKLVYNVMGYGNKYISGIYSNTSPQSSDTMYVRDQKTSAQQNVQLAHGGAAESVILTETEADAVREVMINYKNDGKLKLNGAEVGSVGTDITTDRDILLFARINAANGEITPSAMTMYYAEFTNGDVVTHRLVPAMSNNDNVVGLYDTVTDTFLTNANTEAGSFTAGGAVYEIPIKAYINYYDISEYPLTQKKYINGVNGNVADSNNYAATLGYVPCKTLQGKTVTLNKRSGGNNPGIAFYASNKTRNGGLSNGGAAASTPWTFTVPSNAHYMRFSVPVGETDIMIYDASEVKTYNIYVDAPLGSNEYVTINPKENTAVITSSGTDTDVKDLQDWTQDFKLPKADKLIVTADTAVKPSEIELDYWSKVREDEVTPQFNNDIPGIVESVSMPNSLDESEPNDPDPYPLIER